VSRAHGDHDHDQHGDKDADLDLLGDVEQNRV
jgi:hypothetical protein